MVPSRYAPLLAYKYQLLGSTGELESKIVKQVDTSLNRIFEMLEEICDKLAKEEISDQDFVSYMGELEEIISKLPTYKG